MSYPEAIYHGDSGEVADPLRPNDATCRPRLPPTARRSTTSPPCASDRRRRLRPRTAGTWRPEPGRPRSALPPHDQREQFIILVRHVTLGDVREDCAGHAGGIVQCPPGGLHGLRAVTRVIVPERMMNVSLIVRWKCRSGPPGPAPCSSGRGRSALRCSPRWRGSRPSCRWGRRGRQVCRRDAGGRRPRRSRRGRSPRDSSSHEHALTGRSVQPGRLHRPSGYGELTHSSRPSWKTWCFQTGTVALSRSISAREAAYACPRCGADAATSTAMSPISR